MGGTWQQLPYQCKEVQVPSRALDFKERFFFLFHITSAALLWQLNLCTFIPANEMTVGSRHGKYEIVIYRSHLYVKSHCIISPSTHFVSVYLSHCHTQKYFMLISKTIRYKSNEMRHTLDVIEVAWGTISISAEHEVKELCSRSSYDHMMTNSSALIFVSMLEWAWVIKVEGQRFDTALETVIHPGENSGCLSTDFWSRHHVGQLEGFLSQTEWWKPEWQKNK